ncbi:DUF1127 domain-containing protein [Devosia sp.]|uniref:DUF1127 domain-containing protein n=1 Tax=Devosia sp. TaxID=1871048 RepID=UPI002FCC10D8
MFEPLLRKFVDWRLRRTTIRKLHSLDDRLLADLGTQRDEIARFVASIDSCH